MIFKRNFWFNFFIVLVMIGLFLSIILDKYEYRLISDIRIYTYVEYIFLYSLIIYFIVSNSITMLKKLRHKKHYKYLIPITSALMILSILAILIGLMLTGNRIDFEGDYYQQSKNISNLGKKFLEIGLSAFIAITFYGIAYALTYENVRKTGYYSKDE